MPETDPILNPPPTPPEPERLKKSCEFCGCSLAANGDVLRMSDTAKEYKRQEGALRDASEELTKVQGELAAARTEIAELKKQKESKKSFSLI